MARGKGPLFAVVRAYRQMVGRPEKPDRVCPCGGEGPGTRIIGGLPWATPCPDCGRASWPT